MWLWKCKTIAGKGEILNVGSLFSGIGGIELGFEREGFKTKWFVEKEPFCQAVLKKRWPGVPIYGDVSTIDFSVLKKVDVLTGGFPCQDISIAGKGKGIVDGARSSLWKYFAKAIGQIRPRYAIIENVSALTFRGLSNVLADLAKEGYDAEWFDLRASDFGAPHKRERIFIVAYSNSNRFQGKFRQSSQGENQRLSAPFFTWDKKQMGGVFKNWEEQLSESHLDRVAYGVPDRVDRTKSLGNAVVPQVAQFIARRIKEIEVASVQEKT